jgi:hypothetical protein
MKQIFICYRRDDSAAFAGRIYDRLSQKYGREAIFKDVDSIPLGVNFKVHLDSVVKRCDVVLVLVGERWLETGKSASATRIHSPRDFVRIELESALKRDIPVIPLLIEDAEMPSEDDLPPEIKDFAYRNGMSIRHDPYFHRDVDQLIDCLNSVFAEAESDDASDQKSDSSPSPVKQSSSATPFGNSVALPVIQDQHGKNVLQLAVGIETLGGVFTKLIQEKTPLPLRHSEIFTTASDDQTSVEVSVFAGLRPMAKDNLSIGKFHLVGIPPAPRGMPQIEVHFEIDEKGIVNVSAKDIGTGREQKISITNFKPSTNDIERVMRDAESHSLKDAQLLAQIEARNRLDGLIYQIEKTLHENRNKIEPNIASELDTRLSAGKTAIAQGEVNGMNESFQQLQDASHRLAEALYQPEKKVRDIFG